MLKAGSALLVCAAIAFGAWQGLDGGGEDASAVPPHPNEVKGFAKSLARMTAQVAPVVTGGAPIVPGPTYEVARAEPGARIEIFDAPGGRRIAVQGAHTEFGSARTFHVAEHRGNWLGVMSDAPTDNALAWIRPDREELLITRTNYSVHADLSEQTVEIRYGDRLVKRFPVTVGRAGSETPAGTYSVTDALAGKGVGPYYGCCVMALSGHQPNLPPDWIGGDRIAIHGTPGGVGGAASLGCLRARDEDMAALFLLVPLGAPVFIRT